MKKIWLTHTLVLCFLISLIAVGVYAGISTEVGTYVWDSTNSRWTKLLGSSAGAITLGNKTPADAYTNPTDAINSIGLNMVYDNSNAKWMMQRTMGASGTAPTGNTTAASGIVLWDSFAAVTRLLKDANSADNLTSGLPATALYGYDGAAWDRLISSGNNSDAVATSATGVLFTESFNKAFNGTSWDRIRNVAAGTNLTTGLLATGLYGYDAVGGNWDRVNVDTTGAMYVNPGVLLSTSDSVKAVKEKVSSTTTESSTANNCTGTTASLISSNANRIELIVLNQAAIDAYVCFAATCTTTTGMKLTENMGITNEHYTGAVSCITASGTTTIAVKEL